MRLIAEINVEEGLAGDIQREAQHLCPHSQWLIALGEALPLIEHRNCSPCHQRAEGGQSLSMESGLHEVPLVQPGFPAVSDESLTEQWHKHLVGVDAFVVVLVFFLQDMLDTIRVIDQVSVPEKEAYPNNITILLGHGQSKTQRVAPYLSRTPKKEMTMWTWSILVAEQYGPSGCFSAWFSHLSYPSFGNVPHDRDITLSRLV